MVTARVDDGSIGWKLVQGRDVVCACFSCWSRGGGHEGEGALLTGVFGSVGNTGMGLESGMNSVGT